MNQILETDKMTEVKRESARQNAAPQTDDIAVVADKFSVYYNNGKFQAVKEVSMGLHRGEVTAIIGPSGCGKSTFLRCINRMNDLVDGCSTSGLLAIDGVDIYHPRLDVVELRRRIGMVFQRPNPFPDSSAESAGRSSTTSSKRRCGAPRFGTKSRTGFRTTRWECRAGSSRGFA